MTASVLKPMAITLNASSVAEPDLSLSGVRAEPSWNAATSYTIGQRVSRSSVHRCFVSIAGGVDATPPEDAPLKWEDDGPTNRHAMFDSYAGTRTTSVGPLSVSAVPASSATDIALFGLENVLSVEMEYDGTYPITYSLLTWYGDPWVSYYFDLPETRAVFDIEGIPALNTRVFNLTFTPQNAGLPMGIGVAAFGRYEDLGCAEFGASATVVDYSRITTDDYGNTKIVPGRSATDLSASTVIDASAANRVKALVERYRATPCARRIERQAQYDYLRSFGLGRVDVIADGPAQAKTDMTIRGLI